MNRYTNKKEFHFNAEKNQFGLTLLITKKSKNKRTTSKTRFIPAYLLNKVSDNYYKNYITTDIHKIKWLREAAFLSIKLHTSSIINFEDIVKELNASELLSLHKALNDDNVFMYSVSEKLYFISTVTFATGIRKILLVVSRDNVDKCKVVTGYYSTVDNIVVLDDIDFTKYSIGSIQSLESILHNSLTIPIYDYSLPLLER